MARDSPTTSEDVYNTEDGGKNSRDERKQGNCNNNYRGISSVGHLNIATPAYKSGLTIHRMYLTGTSCKATYGSTYTVLLFPTQGISLKAPYSLSQSIIF